MVFDRTDAIVIIVGSVLLMAAASSPIPRVFGTPNPAERLAIIQGAPTQWAVAQTPFALGERAPERASVPSDSLTPRSRSRMHTHHTIDYIEFTVRDIDEAKRFYTAAFGWEFTDYGPEYAGIQGLDGEVGGLRQAEEIPQGGPLVILYSDDLEASLGAVRSAGGAVVQEPFSFPGGRRFHFEDPSGNELAVWAEAES